MKERNIAYLDCFSGISGDMLLAALLDAGAPLRTINEMLAGLEIGCAIERIKETVSGIAVSRVRVLVPEKTRHRRLSDILALLESASLSATVRQRAVSVFTLLAEAEAEVHGCAVEDVHFHEVGALDAIVDVVSVAAALELLAVARLYCSALPLGRGWVNSGHGMLPLPAPAVCLLLAGVPVYGEAVEAELVTPTGAALVKAIADDFGPMPSCRIRKVGYGAGWMNRRDGKPNLLRVVIGLPEEVKEAREIEVIGVNIDDWHGEGVGYLSEKLLEAGALDVSVTPVQMKKGRPGFEIKVLAEPEKALGLKQILLSESSAIGLRFHREQRLTLPRRLGRVRTPWGEVKVKKVTTPGGDRLRPEFESCRSLAKRREIALQDVYDAVCRVPVSDFIDEEGGA